MADQQQQQQQQYQQHLYQQYSQQQQQHQHNRSFDMQQATVGGQLGTPKGSPSFLPVLASGPPNAIPVATSSSSAFSSANPVASGSSSWHTTSQQQQLSSSGSRPTPRDRQSSISYSHHNNTTQSTGMITHDTPHSASSGQQGGSGGGSDSYNHNSNSNTGMNGGSSTASTSLVTAVAAGSQNSKNAPKRAIQSCAECKRRKIKCDRVYPCSPCKLRGEEALCREVEKQEPIHMPVPTMMDFEAACARISQLEDMMTTLQKLVTYQGQQTQQLQQHVQAQQHNRIGAGLGASGEPTSPRLAIGYKTGHQSGALALENSRTASPAGFDDRKNPPPPSRNYEEVVRQAKSGERDHEDMAMMLEDFAMNNRQNREKAAKLMGAPDGSTGAASDAPLPSPVRGINGAMKDPMAALSSFINPADFATAQQQQQQGSSSSSVEVMHPLAGITNPTTDYLAKFFSQAPDAVRGWQLVQFYFTHLEWYSRVLHAPTFLAECRNLLSLPINAVSTRVRPAFLATYFMVLCLALQFIEEQDRINLGLTAEEAQTYCTNMFTAVQGLLHLCDFMGHHSLEHLQIIALMGVYQYNVGEADSHWALLGSAIKIAQNIGMSRLGSERADMKWPEAWQNPLKREIGRRVWWNMIFLDWSLATAHNACYSIHPSQNFTDFPANVDDNDLQDNQPINARPLDQHTDTSFTICRLKFVALYRELVDHHITHSSPSYTFILEMDTRIVNLLDSLPPYFRGATPPAEHINDSKVMECLLIQLIGETRLLRLHRPYLSRGYRDRKYAPSKERCVNSARSILVLLKTAEKASPILLGQWLTLFYGFGAAVVTFIDLCHGKATDNEASSNEKRQHVSEMISLLKSAKHVSDAARRATQLLEGLLAAEEDCPAWPNFLSSSNIGQKRKLETLDDPDPFRRTVKKLLLDASTKTGSASQASPSSSTGLPQQSPTIFSQAGSAENRNIPTFSGYSSNQPVRPPPFLPDLDLFMESSGKYAHFSKPTPVFANEEPVDSTSADLSHLFVDDILSNLFTTDPLGGPDMAFGGSGW